MRIRDVSSDVCSSDLSPRGVRRFAGGQILRLLPVEETQMATVVPMVTSSFLRHPIVTANGIASLHAMSSGRAMLGRSEERRVGKDCGGTFRSRGPHSL